jgi:murein DD-endopeptidase MepM/ murein hydrolase activator NlpD
MAIVGLDPVAAQPRTFGRARPGQPGMRRADLPRVEAAPVVALPPRRAWRDSPHPLARRWDAWCCRIEARWAGRMLAIDLRQAVGSRRWFVGLARLTSCALPAVLCWPSLAPFDAVPLPVPGDVAQAELRAQAIHPLMTGGASGRHFAATDLVTRLDSVPERATITLTATLGENDDVTRMLQRVGLAARDADAVKALTAALGTPVPGTRFDVTLGPRALAGEPRPLAAMSFRPGFDLDVTVMRTGAGLVLVRHPIPVDATPLHLAGAVGDSLYRAARAAGAAPDTVQAYLQAVDQYMPFEAIAPGDRFELVVAHKRALDGRAADAPTAAGQDGDLLYAGIVRDGKPLLQVMRWGKDGNFYTADALASEAGQGSSLLAAPVAGNITSWFGMRHHPILGYTRMHAGVDFGAAYGSPIYAVSDGVVEYAGWHGGHGNYVRLAHGGGIDTGYGHMSRIAVGEGTHVARGQVIGYVGSTGLSTGPHLHYELFRGGQAVDPLSIRFVPHHTVVSPAEVAGFRARMRQLLALPIR